MATTDDNETHTGLRPLIAIITAIAILGLAMLMVFLVSVFFQSLV